VRDNTYAWLNEHIDVSRETFDRLALYHSLLVKWQAKVNLVGPDTVSDAWRRHFLDSLQLQKYIENRNAHIADIGSGAGFPGVVLALSGYDNMHVVESDAKKTLFMREVARVTNTKITVHHNRIEKTDLDTIAYVTSRALAPLEKLFSLTTHFVSHETICLFHKGKNYITDIQDAKKHWSFDVEVLPSITDTEGVILRIENLRKRTV
jgi:16S rRNA (guanine527-N7)-methyltransferase